MRSTDKPFQPMPLAHVIFITRKWPPAVGGMETYALSLSEALATRVDLDVRALSGRPNGRPPKMLNLLGFVLANALYLLKRRADVVHIGDLVLWPLAWIASTRRTAARVVITAYGLDVVFGERPGFLPWIYRRYLALGVRCVGTRSRIIAISRFTAQLCRDKGFQDVTTVPLGVTRPLSSMDRREVPDPYILFVGRLVPRKGASWFVRDVLPRLPRTIRFIAVGKAWDSDEEAALRGSDRVDYRDFVSAEHLRELRQGALAVVMPNLPTGGTDVEGFGLAALEAVADGGVLLASGIEGLVDAVVDGETGFLLPAGDVEAWASRIEAIRDWAPTDRSAFIAHAREIVAARFSWATVAMRTLDAYGIPR